VATLNPRIGVPEHEALLLLTKELKDLKLFVMVLLEGGNSVGTLPALFVVSASGSGQRNLDTLRHVIITGRRLTGVRGVSIHLAWYWAFLMCSLDFVQNVKEWPQCGGANASIRFDTEMTHGANAGAL
jgi:hypothetical protein